MSTLAPSAAASVLAVLALAGGVARADSDAQLWLEASASRDVSKRAALTFDQHLRLDQDMTRVAAVMPEAGVLYRAARWLRLGVGYRFAYERDGSGDMTVRHRLDADARPRLDVGPLRFGYRLRMQEQLRGADGMEGFRHTVRNRFDVEGRALAPWFFAAAGELFHSIGDGEAIRLRKIRLTLAGQLDLGTHQVELYYRIELPRDDPDDPTLHILGLGYHLAL